MRHLLLLTDLLLRAEAYDKHIFASAMNRGLALRGFCACHRGAFDGSRVAIQVLNSQLAI